MGGDCLRDGPDLSPWREEDRPFVRDAGFKAQHFGHVGLGVQGLHGISSHWQDVQRRTDFERASGCGQRQRLRTVVASRGLLYSNIMSGSRIAWPAGWKGRAR